MTTEPSATATRSVVGLAADVDHMGLAGGADDGVSSRSRRRATPGQQRARRLLDVLLAHQRLADQEGLECRPWPGAGNRHGRKCRFRRPRCGRSGSAAQPLADGERRLEGAQVAVVDADQPALERQRALEFALVMDLDQHVEPEVMRGLVERARGIVVDGGHDDEDAVGAPGARLQHLIGIEQEILAQDRQMASPRAPP